MKKLTSTELMDILSTSLRELSAMQLTDKKIGVCISRSKEIGNLAGKAIKLAFYDLEKGKIDKTHAGQNLL